MRDIDNVKSNSTNEIMPAVHSTKRRKLEHNSSDEESDAIIQNGESDQENESDESEKEETKSKHKVQKNTSRDDHEAMYSVGLYKSSMFKLQLDNLLADVRPNYEKYQGTINGALHEVKALIEGIADREPLGVSTTSGRDKMSNYADHSNRSLRPQN